MDLHNFLGALALASKDQDAARSNGHVISPGHGCGKARDIGDARLDENQHLVDGNNIDVRESCLFSRI